MTSTYLSLVRRREWYTGKNICHHFACSVGKCFVFNVYPLIYSVQVSIAKTVKLFLNTSMIFYLLVISISYILSPILYIYSETSLCGHLYNKGTSLMWTLSGTTDKFLLEMNLYNKGNSHFWAVGTNFRPFWLVELLLHGHTVDESYICSFFLLSFLLSSSVNKMNR